MEAITSRANEKIKQAALLKSASDFESKNRFLLEGARLCADAAVSGIKIEQAFFTLAALGKYTAYVQKVAETAAECFEITEEIADKLADTKRPQGVFCVCEKPVADAATFIFKKGGRYLALEDIQDPANLGAVCRTAEALGIEGLIVTGGCDIYNPKALRAAMGSSLRLRIFETEDLPKLLAEASVAGLLTAAASVKHSAESITTLSGKSEGIICVVGNEGSGLSAAAAKACAVEFTIPMKGKAESLNAAAAAAIIMWEMMR